MVSGEKRNCEGENMLEKATAILLDIEGTTTSISFVKVKYTQGVPDCACAFRTCFIILME